MSTVNIQDLSCVDDGKTKFHNQSEVTELDETVQKQIRGGGSDLYARWEMQNAYPTKYVGPTFQTGDDSMVYETIELTHQGVTRVQ